MCYACVCVVSAQFITGKRSVHNTLYVSNYLYMRSGQRMNDDNIPIVPTSVYFMEAFSSLHVAYKVRYDIIIIIIIIIIIVINTHTVCSIVFVLITRLEITVAKTSKPDDPKTAWSNYTVYV
jgi:hypothetical protein